MTQLEEVGERPEFDAIELDITEDEADEHIAATVAGLHASESAEGHRYRTDDGMLVAIVGPRHTGSGDTLATLAFRTEPASELATRKALKIAQALDEFSIHHS